MTQIFIDSKVAFIKTPIPKLQDDKLEPDMGLLYIATYLKRRFVNAQPIYIDLSVDSLNDITDIIKTCKYFCFSTYTANYYLTLELVAEIKKIAPKGAVYIAGGHHASALPEEVAKDFDYVIVGEGEKAIYSLFSEFSCGKHPESRIIIGECIKSLDEVGWIDYSMVKMDRYTRTVKGQKSVSILTSRGCPYHCNFCNSYLMKTYKSIRFRSAKDVFGEIVFLNKKYGITNFRIQDDIFSINLKRLKELSELLAPYSFSFRCFARIDNMNKEVLTCFKKMGVFHLSFGVESGSQKILDLMNKGITVGQIKQSILLAKEYGVTEMNISKAIPFDIPSILTSQDKFDILLYTYKKELGYEALTEIIKKYDLAELKYIQGETKPCYVITEDEINEIYEKEAITLNFDDKLNIVVQRIYQLYKGYFKSKI